MSTPPSNSYDTLPYASLPFAQTHPERLGVIARLFGMKPALPTAARVLEIGCASGGNLLPMAAQLPGSTFLGVDLSARQVAEGQETIRAAGLSNAEIRHADIMAIDDNFGKFDYIIAHGVYSWIPTPVQDKLLSICRHNLAPQGVAYVSYNTYPGWHMRGMVRDMMGYHARQFADIGTKLGQARALLDFLAKHVPTESGPYGLLLKQEVEALRKASDSYLAHEHLEEHNAPVYFHEFAERSSRHGMQYLGEAEFHTMLATNFPPEAAETLKAIAPNIVQMEQYMDFLRNRVFRQTLLVHQEIALNRNLDWHSVEDLMAGTSMRSTSTKIDYLSRVPERFEMPNGAGIVTPEPLVKAAIAILTETWPQVMKVSDVRKAARARLTALGATGADADTSRDVELVGSDMLRSFAAGIGELRIDPVPMTLTLSERPLAHPLLRYQASRGLSTSNMRHEPVTLDELSRHVLMHLDGTNDHAALLEILVKLTSTDALQVRQGDTTVRDPAVVRNVLSQALPRALEGIRRSGLLQA